MRRWSCFVMSLRTYVASTAHATTRMVATSVYVMMTGAGDTVMRNPTARAVRAATTPRASMGMMAIFVTALKGGADVIARLKSHHVRAARVSMTVSALWMVTPMYVTVLVYGRVQNVRQRELSYQLVRTRNVLGEEFLSFTKQFSLVQRQNFFTCLCRRF